MALLLLIRGGAYTTREILDTLTYINYSESYRRLRGLPTRIPKHPLLDRLIKKQIPGEPLTRPSISKLLYKLKKEGLIAKKTSSNNWKTTAIGNKIATYLAEKLADKPRYQPEKSLEIKIVAFDVPESIRRKRAWLRAALICLGFQMLQKSVWIGKNIIPEEFLLDLEKRNILSYVHIFAVTRQGTIKQIS